jgi:predicted RNase H-like HicB family nuclease
MTKRIFDIKTKYGTFQCISEPERDMGGYTIQARLNGAVSWGRTLVEAKKKITEAIEGMIEAKAIINAERKGIIKVKSSNHPILVA